MRGVCVLYAVCDRTELLRTSLHRLRADDMTQPDEVIVVDDGGTDPALRGACEEFGARYIRTENPGEQMCAHARNVGINATDRDLVITSEPEMLFVTDVVGQLAAEHAAWSANGFQVAANVGTVFHEQPPGSPGCPCGCGERMHKTENWEATWVTLWERRALLGVGGWDEGFPDPWGWDDTDLLTRLRISGWGKVNMLPAQAVHQWHPPRLLDQHPNEAYFRAKGFFGDERPDHPELVANRAAIAEGTWGAPRS